MRSLERERERERERDGDRLTDTQKNRGNLSKIKLRNLFRMKDKDRRECDEERVEGEIENGC